MRTLIVPGLNGSVPGHWQTLWEEKYGYKLVEQRDWEKPDLLEWINTLHAVVTANSERTVLVAHSMGCLTVAHLAHVYPENVSQIQCALMVTPPDVELSPNIPEALRQFATHEVIPFPTLLVGSESDHYMTLESARRLAGYWKSRFVNAGTVGHINLDSGHGPWPWGEALLKDIIKHHDK